MAYERTNWQTGDIITAEKLNNMENALNNNINEGYAARGIVTIDQSTVALVSGFTIADLASEYIPHFIVATNPQALLSGQIYMCYKVSDSRNSGDKNMYFYTIIDNKLVQLVFNRTDLTGTSGTCTVIADFSASSNS